MTAHTHRVHLFRSIASIRVAPRLGVGALLVFAALLPIGCRSATPPPATSPAPYQGPSLAVDRQSGQCLVQMEAPTPGWAIRLDQVIDRLDYHEVYITIRRPDPAFMYPQVIVQQSLATTIPPQAEAWIYARILDHADRTSPPYRLVTKSKP